MAETLKIQVLDFRMHSSSFTQHYKDHRRQLEHAQRVHRARHRRMTVRHTAISRPSFAGTRGRLLRFDPKRRIEKCEEEKKKESPFTDSLTSKTRRAVRATVFGPVLINPAQVRTTEFFSKLLHSPSSAIDF